MIQLLIIALLFNYSFAANLYNVQNFGAKPDGKSDCTNAFLGAWAAACATARPATIYVPPGRYVLKNAIFSGSSCKNEAITIRIDGTLTTPSSYKATANAGNWLMFYRVAGVSISGGTLDGQGAKLWACKNSGKSCPKGTTSLGLYNSDNVTISGLTSLNSQMFHLVIYGSRNVSLVGTNISAAGNSPNTDGIHIQQSSAVTIMNSSIGTGDDCISIGPGTSNVWIENLSCGPGHGVSIGSLGWSKKEQGVENITVKTATFTGTQNGVRIKTWARPSNGFVRRVLFESIIMDDAKNPIIINQNYCPNNQGDCPNQGSGVNISDITYRDVCGTSASQVGVKLDCSQTTPCSGVKLDGVELTYDNEPAATWCANEVETASNVAWPTICL